MSIEKITNYTCLWDMDDHVGYIGLFNAREGLSFRNPQLRDLSY